jgi:aminoglycoside phosphotransferase (APT) family kinase protein
MTTTPALSFTTDVTPVLAQHQFDEASLQHYLLDHVDGFVAPLHVAQTQGGMSNPTFILTDGAGQKYVMRKKPPGKLLPSAHAVDREFRVISALWNTDVPVARPYVLCQDPTVVGTDFYLMGFVEGRVFRQQTLPSLTPQERHEIYMTMADTLAKLHRVDFRAVGLADYGRVGGYYLRQVTRWSQQYEAAKTEPIPAMDKLMQWLPKHIPAHEETTIAHGDFRLENLIFHSTEPRVLAVIDWELSTLGAPISDLAYNCIAYHVSDPLRGDITNLDYASYGIPSEEEYVARYCQQMGRTELLHWHFDMVLSLFRLASILQGVYKRGLDGNAASPDALLKRDRCGTLANMAWELVEKNLT